jgi:DNA mismatch repair ATPase MutS
LAGIPTTVIERASRVLQNLEAYEYDLSGKPRLAKGADSGEGHADQMMLFAPAEEVVASILKEVDLERLSPLAALNLLHSLKARLDE